MTKLILSANPGGLHWLADCPRLAGPTASGKLARLARTVHFDTPDLRLYRRGLALQVRQEGNRFVQQLAILSEAGDSAGREWVADIAGPEPALERLPATEIGPTLAQVPRDKLVPVLAWRVNRQTRILQEPVADGDVEIFEIAFDEGEIETADPPIPIAELALTVLRGPADAAYRLALDLQRSVPLNIEPRSRLERGLQRIADAPPRWCKAKRLACTATTPIDAALAALFRASLDHFLANEGAALDGRDAEGVHQVRVALRRIRSAFSAFAPLFTDATVATLKSDARWLAGNLGPARDWDVFLTTQLADIEARHPGEPALAVLRRHAEDARKAAYHQARAALLSQRTTRFVLELGRWSEAHGWRAADGPSGETAGDGRFDAPLADYAQTTLDRQYRKIRRCGRGFNRLPSEIRHRLRIDIKKLRYTAEFFVPLFDGKVARRFVGVCSRLQDTLGEMNDVAMLGVRLDLLQAAAPDDTALARGIGMVVGAAGAHAAASGEAGVREAWRRFRCSPVFWPAARA